MDGISSISGNQGNNANNDQNILLKLAQALAGATSKGGGGELSKMNAGAGDQTPDCSKCQQGCVNCQA